ncbi:uncharacterized protein LOC110455897 isoform X2 [Mizuhopecten yessoensis]|nr:uncharacterized protein LOC110455897 isoform X2 [Mizuhopecten yessoensis]
MKVFLICLLFAGANAGFLDSLQQGPTNVKEELASKVSAHLSPLLGAEWGNFLGHIFVEGVEVAGVAVIGAAIGKREVPHKVTIKDVLHNGARALEQMFDDYATELQHFHEEIASLAYLKGDVNQFFASMQDSKLIHDKELDNIVSSVNQTLRCDKRKRKAIDNIIFSRACVQFSSAANKLKETFSDVHNRLVGGSKHILEAVNDHISLLNDTLSH